MARDKKKRPVRRDVDRFSVMNELRKSATDAWAASDNAVKRRVGRLEIAWREGLQWLAEDIQAMFGNFKIIGDAYDTLDINVAAMKAILIEKGVFTDAEFEAKRIYLVGVLNAERQRRQEELERLQQEAEEEANKPDELDEAAAQAEAQAADGSKVTPELKGMHRAAKDAGSSESIEIPTGATVFGG